MSKVGIVAPMPSELAPITRALRLAADGAGRRVGTVGSVSVVAVHSGMGMGCASAATERLLSDERCDRVMVVGIAGGIAPTPVGAIVHPVGVRDGATGEEFASTPLAPAAGLLSSSDEFVVDPDRLADFAAQGILAVDMETAAVARVCATAAVPWSAVRVVSDLAADHPDDSVLGLAHVDGSPDPWAAARFVLRHPTRLPGLVRLGRDATRAARAAAGEAARQLRSLAAAE